MRHRKHQKTPYTRDQVRAAALLAAVHWTTIYRALRNPEQVRPYRLAAILDALARVAPQSPVGQ